MITKGQKYRDPLLFMAAALVVCILSWLLLFRGTPERASANSLSETETTEFNGARHLTAVKRDSFMMLLRTFYPKAISQQTKEKLSVKITGEGARASDFYNDNPNLLKISSKEFFISHDKVKDEIAATFTLHTEGGDVFLRVPHDILFQLTQKAANAPHG